MERIADSGSVEGEAMSEHDQREDYDDEPWRGRRTFEMVVKTPSDIMWSLGLFQLLAGFFTTLTAGWAFIEASFGKSPPPSTSPWTFLVVSIFAILGIATSAFILRGASNMKRFQRYDLAVIASLLTLSSLPCVFALPYSAVIGIWTLMVLRRHDVRARFDAGARGTMSPNAGDAANARLDRTP